MIWSYEVFWVWDLVRIIIQGHSFQVDFHWKLRYWTNYGCRDEVVNVIALDVSLYDIRIILIILMLSVVWREIVDIENFDIWNVYLSISLKKHRIVIKDYIKDPMEKLCVFGSSKMVLLQGILTLRYGQIFSAKFMHVSLCSAALIVCVFENSYIDE